MGTISRPTKTDGNTTYAAEVAAGADTIKASEVDADLDLLYSTINALDHNNLSASAGILGSQLDAAAGITGGQLAAGSLTTANLSATAGILGSQLSASAGIVATQLVAGFPLSAATLGQAVVQPLSIAAGVEGDLLSAVVSVTARGPVVIVAQVGAYAGPPTSSQGTVKYRIYKDTAIGAFTVGNRIAELTKQVGPVTVNGLVQDASVLIVAMDQLPGAGAHTYKVTAEPSSSLTQVPYATQTLAGGVFVMVFN